MDDRGSLDVPEWVSELRRLYVEPKTRAELRQEGVIAPQKRRLGLPGGRGSRRGATDAPGAGRRRPVPPRSRPTAAVAVPVPVAPEALRPAVLEPADATLAARRVRCALHAARPHRGGEGRHLADRLPRGHRARHRTSRDRRRRTAGSQPRPPRGSPPCRPALASRPSGRPRRGRLRSGDAASRGAGLSGTAASPRAPLDVPAPSPPRRSRSTPSRGEPRGPWPWRARADASPADDSHSEPWRAAHEGAGVLVSTGGDAATPNPAHQRRARPRHPSRSPDRSRHSPCSRRARRSRSTRLSCRAPPSRGAEHRPGRHAVLARSGVVRDRSARRRGLRARHRRRAALAAGRQRRGRRRDIDTEGDTTADPVVVEPLPATAPVEEAPATRASARAASGYQSGKRRRAMVVGLVLVMLAIVAWYFLLRGDGDDSASGPTSPIGGSSRCRRAVAGRSGVRAVGVARLGAEPTALRRKGFAQCSTGSAESGQVRSAVWSAPREARPSEINGELRQTQHAKSADEISVRGCAGA